MLPNTLIEGNTWPTLQSSDEPSVLTSIYDDNTNIALWQRAQQNTLDTYAKAWATQYPSHTPRLLLSIKNIDHELEKLLPDLDHKAVFKQDVALIIDMFACLFDVGEVGLRLTPLTKAMCPKFHVDNIPCRLVTTYGGLGTEWLLEENIDRSRLGKGANGLPDKTSGIMKNNQAIQQLNSQDVALLKGSGWVGNENYGLVHRSPALGNEQTRLLMSLDFS